MISVGIEKSISPDNSPGIFSEWCLNERRRLMEQDHKLFSDIEVLRKIASVDRNDPANYTYQKSIGHLGRVSFRLQQLESSRFDPEIAGLCIYSCLKLAVGQQVRRAYTVATDQEAFVGLMNEQPDQLFCGIDYVASAEGLINRYKKLQEVYVDTLDAVTDRANTGSDWSLPSSESVSLIDISEKASFGMAASVLYATSEHIGTIELVPLRPPSSDADNVDFVYPFKNK
jgi:hypothetical protein